MAEHSTDQLESFIVKAKAATYAGDGKKLLSYRQGSQDLQFAEGDWAYHDSYFGSADFIGQEVVYHRGSPLWAMNYYGRLLRPDLISAAETGRMIKRSLTALYQEGRFLGPFHFSHGDLAYTDTNEGTPERFSGREWIERAGARVYELDYHGGLIK